VKYVWRVRVYISKMNLYNMYNNVHCIEVLFLLPKIGNLCVTQEKLGKRNKNRIQLAFVKESGASN